MSGTHDVEQAVKDAVARKFFERILQVLQAWSDLGPDLCQLLDGWHCDTAWSEWDTEVRKKLSEAHAANDHLLETFMIGKFHDPTG